MVEVKWTELSIEDMANIAEFISKDSEKYARLQVELFIEQAKILETHPQVGRAVPELKKRNFRELIIGNYRMIYKIINAKRIDILTIHHSARLIKSSPIYPKRRIRKR